MLRLSLISCALAASLSAAPQERAERRLAAMGTHLTVEAVHGTRMDALRASEAAIRAIEATEQRLSTWSATSTLARLNDAGEAQLDEVTAHELERALTVRARTGGSFEPVCGALVSAWALRTGGTRPSEDELARARARTGAEHLVLDGRRAQLSGGATIEEGGFGKGAGLDRALDALEGTGATAATLDLGGQLAWFGAADREFDVADPDRRGVALARVTARPGQRSAATSGNSERGLVVDGERLGHLLDPRTGRPAPDFGSITVLAPHALEADALATGLYVLGPERALALGESLTDVDVLVVERGESGLRVRHTSGLEGRFERISPTDRQEPASPARSARPGFTTLPPSSPVSSLR